jgi:hypothetical protein
MHIPNVNLHKNVIDFDCDLFLRSHPGNFRVVVAKGGTTNVVQIL